ncbi:MAG: 3'-5' exonuclease, partial [Petrimonas sp.]|nr:3'-5' exonuclease [Petrimonas sp.]
LTPEGMSRAQNIQELLNAINVFVSERREQGDENIRLADFLSEVSLLTDQDMGDDADNERVTLMTVHSAQGLEFNHVFVVGMEEGLFPSDMAKFEPRGLEEERRLFYVAITRAKKTCTITFAKSRFRNGTTNITRESQFLKDIDSRFLLMEQNTLPLSGKGTPDGFWESLRRTPVNRPVNTSLPLSEEAEQLKEGNVIEHERFGRGVVTAIEQSGGDKRAFVEFDSAGQKQLLLKFAKFKIVE